MKQWNTISNEILGPIKRVVGVYEIGPPCKFLPIASFKVKILENSKGSYIGIPNIAINDKAGLPDWVSGLGETEAEALEDTINQLRDQLSDQNQYLENDFCWAENGEF